MKGGGSINHNQLTNTNHYFAKFAASRNDIQKLSCDLVELIFNLFKWLQPITY